MKPFGAFAKWFAIGAVVAGILLVAQIGAVGGVKGLLQVGEVSELRPVIEAQLGEVPLIDGGGHDTQIFYGIGLDLTGREVPDLLDHGGYRYRRILEPVMASAGGILEGEALIWGMIVVTVLSAALASGATAAVARRIGLPDYAALAVVLNPGVWLGVRLLTSDVVALAAMCIGLLAFVSKSRWALLWFALSGLAKEVFLVTPAGLALSDSKKRWALILVPVAALVGWMAVVTSYIGDGFTGRGNIDWPLAGMAQSIGRWSQVGGSDLFYSYVALGLVLVGAAAAVRSSWIRWSLVGWVGLAVVSSSWVWDFGNNSARAFAPILVLAVVSMGRPPDDPPIAVEREGERLTRT